MSPWNLDIILPLVLEAGKKARNHPKRRQPERKSDCSWVTSADLEIEEFLREGLAEFGAGFIGEESLEFNRVDSPFLGSHFVIDPIDGTAPYTNGLVTWGVSIGLMKDGAFKEGVLYLPSSETIIWTEGKEVFANVLVDFFIEPQVIYHKSFSINPPESVPEHGMVAISQVIAKSGAYRGNRSVLAAASSVWAMAQLALGRISGYISKGSLWDFAGALPILSRLGFKVGLFGEGIKNLDRAENLFCGFPSLGAREHIILAPTEEMVLEMEHDSFID